MLTAKLAYLKQLEHLLGSQGVKSSHKLRVSVEPILDSRITQFRELMQDQNNKLSLSIVQDGQSKYRGEDNLDLSKLYYEEVEGMIEAEYKGCLRIEGVSIDRHLNHRFYEYDLDLGEPGVLKYSKK